MREGFEWGCWMYPLLPPLQRGTGIAVNVGRMKVLATRSAASRWVRDVYDQLALDSRFARLLRKLEALGVHSGERDQLWAACATLQNYTSVLVLHSIEDRPELILATPECAFPGGTRELETCFPPNTPVHMGWEPTSGSPPCTCAETVGDSRYGATAAAAASTGWKALHWATERTRGMAVLNCDAQSDAPTSALPPAA